MNAPRIACTCTVWAALAVGPVFAGCSSDAGGSDEARPAAARKAAPEDATRTRLPKERPERLEIELRRRPDEGGSELVRITSQGVRYAAAAGIEHHRVNIGLGIEASKLDAVYETLREHAFDRIDAKPDPEGTRAGTSIRLQADGARYSASTMGEFAPPPGQRENYDACVQALLDVLPSQTETGTPLRVRFAGALEKRRATVDIDAGEALAGVEHDGADLLVKVRDDAGPIDAVLRFGPPAQEVALEVDAATTGGLFVGVDPETGTLQLTAVPRGTEMPTESKEPDAP